MLGAAVQFGGYGGWSEEQDTLEGFGLGQLGVLRGSDISRGLKRLLTPTILDLFDCKSFGGCVGRGVVKGGTGGEMITFGS